MVDLVVLLVALADAHQDLDRLLQRRLFDHDRLEAALERGVALDVLAVLVERRRADALELAAGERRLEDVGGIDGALGRAGADERVQLVDEQDGVVRVAQLLDDLLEPLLELAAVLRAGDERADVEGQDALVEQRLGDVAGDDAVGQALGDGRLADAGLADQGGVVLGRRDRIWMTRSISFSRPITGSSLPARAASVRLIPSWSTVGVLLARLVSWVGPAEELWERTRMTSWRTLSRLTPSDSSTPAAIPSPSRTRPRSRCSVPM